MTGVVIGGTAETERLSSRLLSFFLQQWPCCAPTRMPKKLDAEMPFAGKCTPQALKAVTHWSRSPSGLGQRTGTSDGTVKPAAVKSKETLCICVPALVGPLIRYQSRPAPVISFGAQHAQHGQALPSIERAPWHRLHCFPCEATVCNCAFCFPSALRYPLHRRAFVTFFAFSLARRRNGGRSHRTYSQKIRRGEPLDRRQAG
jgi:hypothetical protein